MGAVSSAYARFQASNPERDFSDDLIMWRERDDITSVLADIFKALEVVPGITFNGVTVTHDESKFPADLVYNDVEPSRLDLAHVSFTIELQDMRKDITLSIFLPKLLDGLFYQLNGNLYYPILQLVDRGTYSTKQTFTLKTLLMPLVFRREMTATLVDLGSPPAEGKEPAQRTEMLYVLDLFRSKINVMRYYLAAKGLAGTLAFFGLDGAVAIVPREELAGVAPGEYRAYGVAGPAGLAVAAPAAWVEEDPHYRGALLATLGDALEGVPRRAVEEDDMGLWARRLGKYFTQNTNGLEEKAAKIIVSLERILDNRTRSNLAHVVPGDKEDVYGILRWMMREYRTLSQVDSMDLRNKRIRMAEYLVHPLLIKFSDSTYRLLNSKSPTFKQLLSIFKQFMHEEDGSLRPQVNFLIKKIVNNELLRFVNVVNSFDLLTALRWTVRGPQGIGELRGGEAALRYRGHHPSYLGRIGLNAASSGDPGTSGTLVPFCKISGQFFL